MSHRVVIVTEIIAPYRIPVFNALAKMADIDLHVIFLAETDTTQRQWLIYKDEIQFSYEVLRSWRRRILGYNFLLNWGLSAALQRFSPDAIIFGGYNYFASWRGLEWARAHRVPALLWSESNIHDLRSGNGVVEFLKRTFIRTCDAYIVPGTSSRDYLTRYGVHPKVIFTAPNAVDNELFAAKAEAARADSHVCRQALNLPERYFIFVGRLIPAKGVFDLLDAYAMLPVGLRNEFGLVLVGDGPAREELERRAAALRAGTVRFVGFAQRDQLGAYYGLADVFVFPTHSDRWGLVINEAMACGLPVLSNDIAGGVADLVSEGENGQVVPARDVSAMAKAMATMTDAARLGHMGASSRLKIRAFSPQAWATGIKSAVKFATRRVE